MTRPLTGPFAFLTMDFSLDPISSSSGSHKSNIGVIVGPVVAAITAIILLMGIFLWFRQRRHHKLNHKITPLTPETQIFGLTGTKTDRSLIPSPYTQPSSISHLSPNRYQTPGEPPSTLASSADTTTPQPPPAPPPSFDLEAIITAIAHRIDAPVHPNAPLPQYRS